MEKYLPKNRTVRNGIYLLMGTVLYALALNIFLVGNNIAAGGISGIAIIINSLTSIRISVLVFVMNVPLLVIGTIVRGWEFTRNTVIGSILYTVLVEASSYLPTATHDPLVATVFGGAMYGLGTAFLVFGNGSTGGTDIIIRVLVKIFPEISVGKMSLFVDGSVVVLAMIVYGNIEVGLYAILTIYISSVVADRVILGFDRGTLCLIITDKPSEEIAQKIMDEIDHTVTELSGRGMYSGTHKNVLLAAIKPTEMPTLKRIVYEIDRDAFVVVMPANEILGNGFKSLYFSSMIP